MRVVFVVNMNYTRRARVCFLKNINPVARARWRFHHASFSVTRCGERKVKLMQLERADKDAGAILLRLDLMM